MTAFGGIPAGTRVEYNCLEWPFLGRITGTVRQSDVTGRHLVWFDCGHADWIVQGSLKRLAIADTHPKGGDAKQAPSLMSGSGAGTAIAQPQTPISGTS